MLGCYDPLGNTDLENSKRVRHLHSPHPSPSKQDKGGSYLKAKQDQTGRKHFECYVSSYCEFIVDQRKPKIESALSVYDICRKPKTRSEGGIEIQEIERTSPRPMAMVANNLCPNSVHWLYIDFTAGFSSGTNGSGQNWNKS